MGCWLISRCGARRPCSNSAKPKPVPMVSAHSTPLPETAPKPWTLASLSMRRFLQPLVEDRGELEALPQSGAEIGRRDHIVGAHDAGKADGDAVMRPERSCEARKRLDHLLRNGGVGRDHLVRPLQHFALRREDARLQMAAADIEGEREGTLAVMFAARHPALHGFASCRVPRPASLPI